MTTPEPNITPYDQMPAWHRREFFPIILELLLEAQKQNVIPQYLQTQKLEPYRYANPFFKWMVTEVKKPNYDTADSNINLFKHNAVEILQELRSEIDSILKDKEKE